MSQTPTHTLKLTSEQLYGLLIACREYVDECDNSGHLCAPTCTYVRDAYAQVRVKRASLEDPTCVLCETGEEPGHEH